MKKMRSLFLCLLALMIPAINAPAFADYLYREEFYYTPGKDCIIAERWWGTITLKGKQPARIYSDGYDLGLSIENRTNNSIEVYFGYYLNANEENQYKTVPNNHIRFQIPGNSTQDCFLPVVPEAFLASEDYDPADVAKIQSFAGIDTMEFTKDVNYIAPVNEGGGTIIDISELYLIHFLH